MMKHAFEFTASIASEGRRSLSFSCDTAMLLMNHDNMLILHTQAQDTHINHTELNGDQRDGSNIPNGEPC